MRIQKEVMARYARAKKEEKRCRAIMKGTPPDDAEYDTIVDEINIRMHEIDVLKWVLNGEPMPGALKAGICVCKHETDHYWKDGIMICKSCFKKIEQISLG
jgi:hypothetical protein